MPIELMEKIGKAYGFFYYAGGKRAIQNEIPAIRKKVYTPLEMKLSLRGIDNLNTGEDSALAEIAERAKSAKMNYVIEADLPGRSNQRTASEVGDILNGIRYHLYDQRAPFCAGIVYQKGKKYVFKRD
jgi:hypothetical protein